MADEPKILEFKRKSEEYDPDEPVFIRRPGAPECTHTHGYIVYHESQEVRCQKCKQRLEPMMVLIKFAEFETRQRNRFYSIKQSIDRLLRKLAGQVRYKCRHCQKMNDLSDY